MSYWKFVDGDSMEAPGCGCCADSKKLPLADLEELESLEAELEDQLNTVRAQLEKKRSAPKEWSPK